MARTAWAAVDDNQNQRRPFREDKSGKQKAEIIYTTEAQRARRKDGDF
jgi:hypothetical protein